ncbi:MAG: SRPBCC family protein [Rhodocyclaceae bacterium]
MRVLKRTSIVLGVIIAAVLLYALTKPKMFVVQRSIIIAAPAEKIFPLIDDFHNWAAWSPYEHLDPAMKRSFTGPARGEGAGYAWDGNSKVGAGSMHITQSSPPSHLMIDLHFLRPLDSRNVAEYTLRTTPEGTRVTWSMEGPNPYIARVMQVFFDAEGMVGKDFETGLAKLKTIAEAN